LLDLTVTALLTGYIVFLRVGGAMALLPAFGETMISVRVRLVLTLAFTLIILPAVAPVVAPLVERGTVIGLFVVTEPIIGVALGAFLRLMVLALQITGMIAAQSTSLSQIFGGTTAEPQPAVGHILTMGGLALAVMMGLHVAVAQVLIGTYDVMPPGQFPAAEAIREWGLSGIVHAFRLAFSLAAPFVVGGLIYNIALGAINRAMPQLMVAFVGAPALTFGGLVLLMLALPTALAIWQGAFQAILSDPFRVIP